ncbi:hypothetical protein VTK73DRAFT_4900 [Phialemonium thermophilum]|uniref:Serine carboxypeptidase n=1 Tax=Phialemonium thermophilum TaxID=223376 RepID=A0ABR3V513_9PEZI
MRVASLLSCAAALSAGLVAAIDSRYFWDKARLLRQQQNRASAAPVLPAVPVRATNGSVFHNANTTKFAVQGDAIPDVDFDAGESYAGQLPIGGDSDGQLFFWFWPTTNTDEPQEILIWLNGGPGCSSLEGLLQENGPISWQAGTYAPVRNPWSWHHLTNVVYIEQPVGTGFSTGTVTARNEDDVADQFMGFWRHFVDTFGLHGYKVFITGESYA